MPWAVCEVTVAGPADDGVIYIGLRDTAGSFPSRWFKAIPAMQNEMLATALTALATGGQVSAHVADIAEYSALQRLYLHRR